MLAQRYPPILSTVLSYIHEPFRPYVGSAAAPAGRAGRFGAGFGAALRGLAPHHLPRRGGAERAGGAGVCAARRGGRLSTAGGYFLPPLMFTQGEAVSLL